MKNFKLYIIAIIMILPLSLEAGIYGTLTGKVLDQDGKPVVGATVRVIGTTNGTYVKDPKGKFTIVKIKSGTYIVRASAVGFSELLIKDVVISADKKTTLKITLKSKCIESTGVTVAAEAIMVRKDDIGSEKSIKSSELTHVERESVSSIVGLSAGVSTSGDGFNIRRSRATETEIRVDGLDVGSGFDGGFGSGGTGGYSAARRDAVRTAVNDRIGVLTSGEVNDFRKWEMWTDLSDGDLAHFKSFWYVDPSKRFVLQAKSNSDRPIVDCEVKLLHEGITIWQSRTDNTGKAELWANMFDENYEENEDLLIKVEIDGTAYRVNNVKEFHEGINFLKVNIDQDYSMQADIVFAVDATSSMRDEIKYLKAELYDIIGRVKDEQKDLLIRTGSIFYRDKSDRYVVRQSNLTEDLESTADYILDQSASGGGDYEEAVEEALITATEDMNWSDKAVARILFLILDAPPHNNLVIKKKIEEATKKAAAMGIRIIPLTCSGIDKATEYLMRSLALATNGTYAFLNNESGVGGHHIEPSTDSYNNELLNDLFIRLIRQFTSIPDQMIVEDIEEEEEYKSLFNYGDKKVETTEESESIKCYPNPTHGVINIESTDGIEEMYLVDMCGKILLNLGKSSIGTITYDLSRFPNGVYFVKYLRNGNWACNKILLSK